MSPKSCNAAQGLHEPASEGQGPSAARNMSVAGPLQVTLRAPHRPGEES